MARKINQAYTTEWMCSSYDILSNLQSEYDLTDYRFITIYGTPSNTFELCVLPGTFIRWNWSSGSTPSYVLIRDVDTTTWEWKQSYHRVDLTENTQLYVAVWDEANQQVTLKG